MMWSDKKSVNIIINIFIYLMAINFMHYGQLFLPAICIVLFADQRFHFKVRNIKTFLILCIFAVSFFIFSYSLGIYSIVGFFLPMAYYIGSQLRTDDRNNHKKLIYILAFGMATYMVLNLCLEFHMWSDRLSFMFNKPSHYDFWLRKRVRTTVIAVNYLLISSCIYYLVRFEEKREIKAIGIILFLLSTVYCVALGRRSTFLILLIVLIVSFLFDLIYIRKKMNIRYLLFIFLMLAILFSIFCFDLFHIRSWLSKLSIIQRFLKKGLFTERFEILKQSLPLFPKYLWGGQRISTETGFIIHNLWGDIYDYSGIVPFLCFLYYSFKVLLDVTDYLNIKKTVSPLNLLILAWFLVSNIIFLLEPIMTGSSIFLISYVVIAAGLEE